MEHIIQFGVNIDDDAIRKEIVRLATQEIIEDLKKECRKELGLTGSCYNRSVFVSQMVDQILVDCREKVIEEAASAFAKSAPRQKWYRDMMPDAVKGHDE